MQQKIDIKTLTRLTKEFGDTDFGDFLINFLKRYKKEGKGEKVDEVSLGFLEKARTALIDEMATIEETLINFDGAIGEELFGMLVKSSENEV